jgi:ABC-2 type transport system ATP-binding protein
MPSGGSFVVETQSFGKRYGKTWALQECSIQVPEGHISALVGPNGSGKTTLLRLLLGLSSPSAGEAVVLGGRPAQNREFLAKVGYLAQEAPLYRQLSVEDHLELGRHLNPTWDGDSARSRLSDLHIPFNQPVGTLSGGQRSQVALGLTLAKRPRLLLLDEPVASLDPLARREFLTSLALAVANGEMSVILSSHSLHDLEQVCDHIILLANSQTQLCDEIENVVAAHRTLIGPRKRISDRVGSSTVIVATHTEHQSRLLVRLDGPILDPDWKIHEVSLEEIVLAYMTRSESEITEPLLRAVGSE